MEIEVAGAGAGKTTSMASRILESEIPEGKVVYCVAFTNAAVDHIKSKLAGQAGLDLRQVKVSTIHSFLYGEIIQPFYHLLFGKRYMGISNINLPADPRFRNSRISELERQGLLHIDAIPRRAKWVVDKKSDEKARTRTLRAKVLDLFSKYCHKIYVDEAQDIDSDMKAVFTALDAAGVDIELHGDPKQDVRGHGCFRELIDGCNSVSYRNVCYRSPQLHLRLSNKLACHEEQQSAALTNRPGSINVFFESQVNAAELVGNWGSGLVYISRKNSRFDTRDGDAPGSVFETLMHEVETGIREKHGGAVSDLDINRHAYFAANRMSDFVAAGGEPSKIIRRFIDAGWFDYEGRRYARLSEVLSVRAGAGANGIAVKSIEVVKGLEAERCLFILTTDLVPYLLGDKTEDNKMKHLLYVALTRSSDELGVLVTREIEQVHPRERILASLGVDQS